MIPPLSTDSQLIIYDSPDGGATLEVRLQADTVWLTQQQMTTLFERDQSVISRHINTIFKEGELDQKSTMHFLHNPNSDRPVAIYSLDVVISVGYRVKSRQGTQFRIWANRVLKEHLIRGYTLNESRLGEYNEHLLELAQVVESLRQTGTDSELQLHEARGLLDIIGSYTRSFVLLNRFDSARLDTDWLSEDITYQIDYHDALAAIGQLKQALMEQAEANGLFGKVRDDSFAGLLGNVIQSFGGQYVYPAIEEQAAHLLYFVIKNHPFADGNKRIGAFLFIWFLEKNNHRFKRSGELKINDNALVALALLIAQSDPGNKELMIKLIINLINQS